MHSAALTGGLYCAGSISGGGLNPCVASALYLANAASHQVKSSAGKMTTTTKPNHTQPNTTPHA